MTNFKFLGVGHIITVIGLFLYSFTQVDLGLTLTQWSIWQVGQTFFQKIGYFNRPLSALFYLVIIFLLFLFYVFILASIRKKMVSKKQAWVLLITASFLLTFSYNAFSYDLFNYVFDAKIVTFYKQNPYLHKALDYPQDPMLSFMHWTHRTYPYGPSWLALTVPLSYLGLGFFLPTILLFKALAAASFLGTAFFIGKILKEVRKEDELLGVALFGLNPLILIESLVSAHNDIVMVFFLMASLYFFLRKRIVFSLGLFLLSAGVKFATLFLLPLFVLGLFFRVENKEIFWQRLILGSVFLMVAAIVLASFRTNFQPWYLLFVMPLVALLPKNPLIVMPTIAFSFFSLLRYVPFLYLGNWDPPVPEILSFLTLAAFVFSGFLVLFFIFAKRKGKTW